MQKNLRLWEGHKGTLLVNITQGCSCNITVSIVYLVHNTVDYRLFLAHKQLLIAQCALLVATSKRRVMTALNQASLDNGNRH